MTLTERIAEGVGNPRTDDGFDPHAEFAQVLAGIGMSPADTGGTVTFTGADPVVPSTPRLGGAAAIALAAKSAAIAKLWRLRGGDGQDVAVDLRSAPHRLCPFYDRKWELLNGYPGASPWNPSQALGFRFYRTADERWVMPLNPYPKIKLAAQTLLGVPDDPEAVAAAIARWRGRDLEEAGVEAGAVLPMLRTTAELLAEAHYRETLADLPLVEITKIGESEPEPLAPGAEAPLSGVRALGMRSATVNPYRHGGRTRELLAGADVFFANRRPGYLAKIGLSAAEAAQGAESATGPVRTLPGGQFSIGFAGRCTASRDHGATGWPSAGIGSVR